MTRELIEDFTKIVKPFVQKRLLEENFEGMGEQDKAEFGRDFDEILSLAIKGLESSTWIPVTERLPENAKHKGAFCPKYYVMTEYGVTEGWYNPDVKCWYVLLWFMDGRFEEWNINIDKGDIPKLVKKVPVIAWMPLPEPYKAESEGEE